MMADIVPFTGTLDGEQNSLIQFTGQLDEPKQPQGKGLRDELIRQLGLTARHAVKGVTGVGSAIADAGVGAANLMGANLPLPSAEQDKMLTRLGLPEPKPGLEQVVGAGSQMVAGAMDPVLNATQAIAKQLAPKGFQPPATSAKSNVTQELREAGYKLPPTEMEGGAVTRTLEGIGGSARTADMAQAANQKVSQELATKALGLPKGTPLNEDTLAIQAKQLIEQGYDPIRNLQKIGVGSKYRADLQRVVSDLGGNDSFPLASRNQIRELVTRYTVNDSGRPIQSYSGADALKEIKALRSEATANFKPGGDPILGEAQRRVATALEDNIETNLKGLGSELLGRFREARVGLAKNFAVERMLADPSTGVVSTAKAAALERAGTPLTDELKTIARAGSPLFSRATGVPSRGNPPPINYGDSMFLGAGGLSAPFTGGAGAALAGIPVARAGARHAVLSEPVQNMLARALQQQPSMFAPAMQRGMVASPFPLFSQGEQ
jgi:hypothetical protein